MSIFVRPVREQLEHDRLIRFLATKYKRKFEVGMNVGDEQAAPLKIGAATIFPDLVLTTGKKLGGIVEVETGESINNLEALAQWVPYSQTRAPFHLYVPMTMLDGARRLCDANQVRVAELWTYRSVADGSFDLVRGFHDASAAAATSPAPAKSTASKKKPASRAPARKPAAKKTVKKAPKKKKSKR